MVPNGWSKKKVSQLFEVQLGKMLNAEAKSSGEQFVYLTNFNVQWGRFDLSKLNKMHFNEKERSKFAIRKGDILVCEGGEVGRCAIWNDELSNCYYQKALHRLRPLSKEISPDYFLEYMRYVSGTKTIQNLTSKTSIPHLTREKLLKLIVLVPPRAELVKIARILFIWNKAIETTEKLIENSKAQKKALMQQLLTGKRRFPEFSNKWVNSKLCDIAYINPSKPEKPEDEQVAFVSMDSVSEDARLLRFESRPYDEVEKGFTSFINKDVLVAKITPCFENGKGAYAEGLINGVGFGSTEFHVIRAKKGTCSKLIYHITNSFEFRFRGRANMQGSAGQKRVPTDYLRLYKFYWPVDFNEQKKIANMLDTVVAEIETLSNEVGALTNQKKALMQQLLTGKRRVKLDNAKTTKGAA